MGSTNARGTGRGFAIIDLAAVVVVVGVVVAILAVGGRESRRVGRLGECLGNLRQYGTAVASYRADNADLVPTFSWRTGVTPSQYPDLQNAFSDQDAAAKQAVDILRRRAGRTDIPAITGWLPHLFYSHLVLEDYFEISLPASGVVCPEDRNRLQWAADPHGFDQCLYSPNPGCGGGNAARWPYSGTYELQPSFCSLDSNGNGQTTIAQAQVHNQFYAGSLLGRRAMTEVQYPSQKVMVYEGHGRHTGPRVAFYAYEEARASVMTADGSAAQRLGRDANLGWRPDTPLSPSPTIMSYIPGVWEPPTLSGESSQAVIGRYRWTRRGLAGRDFGGPDIQ
jgi:hypothetical protein